MFFSESDVTEFIEDNDVKFIRLTFCDTLGAMKNIAILPRELPRAIAYGIPFNATGLLEEQHQNLLLKPECTTLSVLPWRPQSGRVVRFFCNLMTMDGKPYAGDLRQNLRNTMREIEENDYQCQIATRCEFYLFKTDVEGNPTREPYDQGGYLDIAPLDKCENTRREICLSLEEMGLNPTSSCHKHGPGQNEIDFACSNPLTAADNMMHYKTVVKTIAAQNGLYASFMPKPLPNQNGSALKINIIVRKHGQNIFGSCPEDMTPEGKSFIAGILNRICGFTLFANPIVNSYERLQLHTAPGRVNWSSENRVPLIRLMYVPGGDAIIEVRSADAYCNPYITFQMLLRAGMEGIHHQEQLKEEWDAANVTTVFQKLPTSLEEALQMARESEFVKAYLPNAILHDFFQKTEQQIQAVSEAEDAQAYSHHHFF